MVKLRNLLEAFVRWITRENARHNRALRDILYLVKTIEDFFMQYHLPGDSPDFKTLLEHLGKTRIDTTELVYQTGIRIRRSRNIKGKDLPSVVGDIYNALDELQRSLFTRTLSSEVLSRRITMLDTAFENLLNALSGIGYK